MKTVLSLLFLYFVYYLGFAQQLSTKVYDNCFRDIVVVFGRDSLQRTDNYELSLQKWLAVYDTNRVAERYYQLAVNYSELDKPDSAFHYLHHYVNVSKDDRVIFVDNAFDDLKNNQELWKNLTDKIETNYLAQIQYVLDKDLALRLFHLNVRMHKFKTFYQLLKTTDTVPFAQISLNELTIWETFQNIINEYGFPTIIRAGCLGEQTALMLISQHNISKKYYLNIKEQFITSNFDPIAYAVITDKFLYERRKKQKFGSFLFFYEKKDKRRTWILALYPIKDFKNVNVRRRQIGFSETVEEYAKRKNATIIQKR